MDIAVAIFAGVLTAALLFKPIFGTLEDFLECLSYTMTPDILSYLNGESWEDFIAELKLGVWIGASTAIGYGAFWLFSG